MAHDYDDMVVIDDGASDYWRLDTDVDEAVNKANFPITVSTSGTGSTSHDLLPAANNQASNYFNGSSDYVTATTSKYTDFTSHVSVECWFRPDADQSATSAIGLVIKNGSFGVGLSYGKPAVFVISSFDSSTKLITDSSVVSTATNYHIVGTYENSGGTGYLKLYVNGSLVNSASFTGFSLVQNSSNLVVGSWDTSTLFFQGWISNVALYDGVLTSTQVSNHYNYSG